MIGWDRAELSALLDGELDPSRAREIQGLIASDSSVRAAFEMLQQADRQLRAIAQNAAFIPEVRVPQAIPAARSTQAWPAIGFAVIVLASAAGRLAPIMSAGLMVNAGSLALLIACLASFAVREARADPSSPDRTNAMAGTS